MRELITINASINAPIDKVWKYYTEANHLTKWSFASNDWHSPYAEVDLRAGGRFLNRMEAKDGSMGFDFSGTYDEIIKDELISYTLDDGRKVRVSFMSRGNTTDLEIVFEAEDTHPVLFQKSGWQAILDNFKNYTESL